MKSPSMACSKRVPSDNTAMPHVPTAMRGVAKWRKISAWTLRKRIAVLASAVAVLLTGCSTLPDRGHYTADDLQGAHVVGFAEDIRIWADDTTDVVEREVRARLQQERKSGRFTGGRMPPVHMLALSGGGEDGAFGAGLLVGWTQHGDRPQFDVVTGVSTGSLIAPLAFLGSAYDKQLQEAYTTIDKKRVLVIQGLLSILTGEAVASTGPLREMVSHFVTPEMVQAVAAEYRIGRRLYVVTTHLDYQRPMLWDMGRIAISGRPQAVALFREVLVASAAMPGVFPPVYFDVESHGRQFREMHVDGGVTAQVFALPLAITATLLGAAKERERHMYVIINNRVAPQFDMPRRGILPIASRSISTLIKMQGSSGVRDIYHVSKAADAEFNLAYIDSDFTEITPEPFDRGYMNKLFAHGYALGRQGYPWKKVAPGLAVTHGDPPLANRAVGTQRGG